MSQVTGQQKDSDLIEMSKTVPDHLYMNGQYAANTAFQFEYSVRMIPYNP
jgi:hypothetical protein